MSVEVKIPRLAESISEAVLVEWLKADGTAVAADEAIATLETDKAAVEISAPEPGTLRHTRAVGDTVLVGDVIARIEAGSAGAKALDSAAASPAGPPASASAVPALVAAATPVKPEATADDEGALSPAVRRLVEEHRLDASRIPASGRGGRLLKEDVLRHLEETAAAASATPSAATAVRPATPAPVMSSSPPASLTPGTTPAPTLARPAAPAPAPAARAAAVPSAASEAEIAADERVVPMSRIRLRIAERLVQAQHLAAILTTFNEIDMSAVMELRARMKERFEKRHGVRLGFLSFFSRAATLALAEVQELNAEIRGTDVVYRRRVHMGIAVSTERGLVVPVVRDADRLSFAEIEREVERMAARARDHTLTLQELSGGTFTITNGGVFGSLLSTPILNPPQTGILGLHKIEKRPIAVDDQVVIRPMMYVALSYDHRLVDGQGAVTFLVKVKERLEDPERMLLEI